MRSEYLPAQSHCAQQRIETGTPLCIHCAAEQGGLLIRNGRTALAVFFSVLALAAARADEFVREPLRIPASGTHLDALLVRPEGAGRFPLLLLNHGSPRSAADRPGMSPEALLPQARQFAQRGFAVAIVMRRGYGGSGGGWAEGYGPCADPDYVKAAAAAVADLKGAVAFLRQRPDIDATRILAVGHSAGGFATVALTADPPPGLVAGISFAGGRGSQSSDEVCGDDALVEAFRGFGKTSRVPMLWVYATNDRFFGPDLARELKEAFVEGGGKVEFVSAPAFGRDGHMLFSSAAGIPLWTPTVDGFLRRHGLAPGGAINTASAGGTVLPAQPASLAPPSMLSSEGRRAFESYLNARSHKAFAAAPDGSFGWRSGRSTAQEARDEAMEKCGEHADNCRLLFVDDAAAR